MTGGWRAGPQVARCPKWEDRLVRASNSGTTRSIRRQVRCSRPRNHEGACEWHGVAFGTHTAEAIEQRRSYAERSDRGSSRG